MKLVIINGPNLNLLGQREPEVYGYKSFEDYLTLLQAYFPGVDLKVLQSNLEGEIVTWIQDYGFQIDGIILNPGGYAHTSVAILDAIKAIKAPVVEVHISNVFAREPYRHYLISASACVGVISGFGLEGYRMAIAYFSERTRDQV